MGSFLLNKPCLEVKKNVNDKNFSSYSYSNEKTKSKKIKLILDLQNWHWKLKTAFFDSAQSKGLTIPIQKKSFKHVHLDAKI